MEVSSISSKDSDETHAMYTKKDNMEIMISYKTDKIIEELYKSLLQRYQKRLERSMRGSKFVFDSVTLLQ